MKAIKTVLGLNGFALAAALLLAPPVLDAVGLNSGATVHAKGGEGGGNDGSHGGGNSGNSGNSGSNGQSGDHGGSASGSRSENGNKSGNSFGNSADKAADKAADRQAKAEERTERKSLGNDQGAIASKMGSLNAAHASPTARLNANPGSRVGLIAQYEQAVLDGRELSHELAHIDAQLMELETERAALDEVDTTALEQAIAELTAEIEALDASSDTFAQAEADLTVELESLNRDLTQALGINTEIGMIEEQIADLEAREAEAEAELDAAAQTEAESLAAAANKYDAAEDVPDEVVAELNALLGIEPEVVIQH